jgi:hypothetical protein
MSYLVTDFSPFFLQKWHPLLNNADQEKVMILVEIMKYGLRAYMPNTFLLSNIHPIRLAYQPPANNTFLSEQTSQQYFSLRTNQHQPPATSQTNRLIIQI